MTKEVRLRAGLTRGSGPWRHLEPWTCGRTDASSPATVPDSLGLWFFPGSENDRPVVPLTSDLASLNDPQPNPHYLGLPSPRVPDPSQTNHERPQPRSHPTTMSHVKGRSS